MERVNVVLEFAYPSGALLGRPIALVGGDVGSEGRTELRNATGFWMGLGLELLDVGEEACGGE